MIVFFTKSTQHLAEKINLPKADYIVKQFSDGEIYIKINQDIENKEIWIITSTPPPAENLLELFFSLDALTRLNVKKINLFFSYFGYARQAIAQPGEAVSAQLICDILKKFPIVKTYIMHAHAQEMLHTFLNFTDLIDLDFFCNVAKNYDVISAPDKGSYDFAQKVAKTCGKEVVSFKKVRPEHEKVKIEFVNGNVEGKNVLLVDDIISTGRTIIEASEALKNLGANTISAAATHGVLSTDAYERIENSILKKIYVTNTLDRKSKNKLEAVDISKFIESTITKRILYES